MNNKVIKAFHDSAKVKHQFVEDHSSLIVEVAKVIAGVFDDGHKLIAFGNGGSSTDASHIVSEFVGKFRRERPGLPAISLSTDSAVITSLANDYDFSDVFSRQLRALSQPGDIVIAISTSGDSPNIVKALDAAKRKKLRTIVFTGAKGQKLADKATYGFVVPSQTVARIQETHITLAHVICQMVEEVLFEQPRASRKKQ